MTAKQAVRELQNMRQYCTAKSLPALEYAIKVLKEKAESEQE